MASAVTSIYNNVISAASAGFAPTNSADVSAIASAYQVVSAIGTGWNSDDDEIVSSVNGCILSADEARRAGAADSSNYARYDRRPTVAGGYRTISSLPGSAEVSAIASRYAESAASSKQDTLTFGYDAEDKISSIDGSALAGGGIKVSPSGTLWISGESAESTDSAFIPGVATETFVQSGGSFQIGTTQPLTVAGANKVTIQNGSWFDGTIYVSGNGTLVSSVAHAGADWPQTFSAEAPITIGANGWFDVTSYSAFNVVTSPDQVVQLAHASAVSGTVDLVSSQSANWGGSALALSAGPGVKLEKVGNTLVASTDETVLFSGSNGGMVETNLTEPLSSFNSFKICFNPFGNGMSREWKEFSWAGSSDVYTVATFHKNNNDNLAWFAAFQPNTDGTTITPIANKLWVLGSTTVQDRTQMSVYRVVGINRTAEA